MNYEMASYIISSVNNNILVFEPTFESIVIKFLTS
jgi:hypothetical protein